MLYYANDGSIHDNISLCCPYCGYPNQYTPPFYEGERRTVTCNYCDELFIFRCEETASEDVWHYWLEAE